MWRHERRGAPVLLHLLLLLLLLPAPGRHVAVPFLPAAARAAQRAPRGEGGLANIEEEAGELEKDSLSFYSCSDGGATGWAFRRFFAFVKMDLDLRGKPNAVQYVEWDLRRGSSARERVRVWVVDGEGRKAMAGVECVARSKPRLLTSLKGGSKGGSGGKDVVSAGLARKATSAERLRAVFALGCTPMCALVDVEALEVSQLATLWQAVVTLCSVRPGMSRAGGLPCMRMWST